MTGTTVTRWLIGATLTCAVAFAGAAVVQAQDVAVGVLYETLEAPSGELQTGGARVMPGVILPAGERLAQATEAGTVRGFGALEFLSGDIKVQAQSRVPLDDNGAFGTGPISGTFSVRRQDGQLVRGKLEGELDLSQLTGNACGGQPCPVAPVRGTWSTVSGSRTGGTFTGIFMLPFSMAGTWLYLTPAGEVVPLQEHEFGPQGPLVKLQVQLSK